MHFICSCKTRYRAVATVSRQLLYVPPRMRSDQRRTRRKIMNRLSEFPLVKRAPAVTVRAPFMKLLAAAAIFGFFVSPLANVSLYGADPTFEQLDILKTKFDPQSDMVNRGDGYFYGAARWAEGKLGGAVFRVAPHQDAEVLYTFASVKSSNTPNVGGTNPGCGLVLGPDRALYGSAEFAGAYGNGTIYRIGVDSTFSVVHDLQESDGHAVASMVFAPNGDLYGVTSSGGANGGGTLFRMDPTGNFQVVYDFTDNSTANPELPVPPYSPITLNVGADGNIYGTTEMGGSRVPLGSIVATFGTFFRYDSPGSVTVLSDFGPLKAHPISSARASDGIDVGTEMQLVHFDLDGTQTVLANFTPDLNGDDTVSLVSTVVQPDGVYGISYFGGAYNCGFIYRCVPGEQYTVLYHLPTDYSRRRRSMVAGNDNLVYGLAAFPEGYTPSTRSGVGASLTQTRLMATTAAAAAVPSGSAAKPRTFRMRDATGQSANFIPVAKADLAWLPARANASKQRQVTIDVLANDHDPDKNPLTLTGVVPPEIGYAQLVSTAGKLKVQFVTSEADPASRHLTYHIADGRGGAATGDIAVYSLATGIYKSTATDTSTPPAAPATLTITVGEKNATSVSFFQNKHYYAGKGVIGLDDKADILLKVGTQPPMNLHLDVQRGTARKLSVIIRGGGSIYTAVCPQT
jgi:uncharacterized repeat protein (TIGR03803 family)